jgi:Tol biopolymer transport system component
MERVGGRGGRVHASTVGGAVALAAFLLAAALTSTAFAAYPGKNGRIAFELHTNKSASIESVQPNGTDLRRLAPGTDPSWSADGTQMVYSRTVTHQSDIFLMNADGTNQRRVTGRMGAETSPSLSPDGKWIVYDRGGFGGSSINLVRVNGTGGQMLTSARVDATDPEFSPNGKRVVFTQRNPKGIFTIRPDGTGVHRLTQRNGVNPDYSPNGRQIAFYDYADGGWKTFVMRADGSHMHSLACGSYSPAYAPDGQRLAFSHGATAMRGGTEIWTTRLSTPCGSRSVTDFGSGFAYNPSWQPLPSG